MIRSRHSTGTGTNRSRRTRDIRDILEDGLTLLVLQRAFSFPFLAAATVGTATAGALEFGGWVAFAEGLFLLGFAFVAFLSPVTAAVVAGGGRAAAVETLWLGGSLLEKLEIIDDNVFLFEGASPMRILLFLRCRDGLLTSRTQFPECL